MWRKKADFSEPGTWPVQQRLLVSQTLLLQACMGTAKSLKGFLLVVCCALSQPALLRKPSLGSFRRQGGTFSSCIHSLHIS